jgi:hypothetical protein
LGIAENTLGFRKLWGNVGMKPIQYREPNMFLAINGDFVFVQR